MDENGASNGSDTPSPSAPSDNPPEAGLMAELGRHMLLIERVHRLTDRAVESNKISEGLAR